jgi:hypothetical protein
MISSLSWSRRVAGTPRGYDKLRRSYLLRMVFWCAGDALFHVRIRLDRFWDLAAEPRDGSLGLGSNGNRCGPWLSTPTGNRMSSDLFARFRNAPALLTNASASFCDFACSSRSMSAERPALCS